MARVLVAGGFDIVSRAATAELYDPATGNRTFTGSLNTDTHLPHGNIAPKAMARCWSQAGRRCPAATISRARNFTIQLRETGPRRQPQYCWGNPHDDIAAQRQGLVAGGLTERYRACGTLRSRHGKLDDHREPQYCTNSAHGDVAAQWQGAGRWWVHRNAICERGRLRAGDGKLDLHRQPQYCC